MCHLEETSPVKKPKSKCRNYGFILRCLIHESAVETAADIFCKKSFP